MANIKDCEPSVRPYALESVPVTIIREYGSIMISLKCSGFKDCYGETYYNARDIRMIDEIINMIKDKV